MGKSQFTVIVFILLTGVFVIVGISVKGMSPFPLRIPTQNIGLILGVAALIGSLGAVGLTLFKEKRVAEIGTEVLAPSEPEFPETIDLDVEFIVTMYNIGDDRLEVVRNSFIDTKLEWGEILPKILDHIIRWSRKNKEIVTRVDIELNEGDIPTHLLFRYHLSPDNSIRTDSLILI